MIEKAKKTDTYSVTVDYGMSVKEAIKRGKYDWVDSDITQGHFPTERKGKKTNVEITLFYFNKTVSSDYALEEMDKAGYRPAELHELLALGEIILTFKFRIAALGSMWRLPNGDRGVPCLGGRDSEQNLNIDWRKNSWYEGWRFAAVRL